MKTYKRFMILVLIFAILKCPVSFVCASTTEVVDRFGDEYCEQCRDIKAIEEYRRALKIDPNNVEIRLRLAEIYQDINDLDRAIEEYKKVIEIDPDSADIHLFLGGTYYEKGDSDKAIAELKKTLEIDPKFEEAHCRSGLALIYKEKGMIDEAIIECKKVIAIEPENEFANYCLEPLCSKKQVLFLRKIVND